MLRITDAHLVSKELIADLAAKGVEVEGKRDVSCHILVRDPESALRVDASLQRTGGGNV